MGGRNTLRDDGVTPPDGTMAEHQNPAMIRPFQLVLRCYVRRRRTEPGWVAHCIDLDLWAVGSSQLAAQKSLEDAIVSYVEAVVDTDDKASIPALLQRRAALHWVLFWHFLRLTSKALHNGGPLDSKPFQEMLPFRLAPC